MSPIEEPRSPDGERRPPLFCRGSVVATVSGRVARVQIRVARVKNPLATVNLRVATVRFRVATGLIRVAGLGIRVAWRQARMAAVRRRMTTVRSDVPRVLFTPTAKSDRHRHDGSVGPTTQPLPMHAGRTQPPLSARYQQLVPTGSQGAPTEGLVPGQPCATGDASSAHGRVEHARDSGTPVAEHVQ